MRLQFYSKQAHKFTPYPGQNEHHINYLVDGACEEVGEIVQKLKKKMRDKNRVAIIPDDFNCHERVLILKEIGDIIWYLNELIIAFGSTWSFVLLSNLHKLLHRQKNNTLYGEGDER